MAGEKKRPRWQEGERTFVGTLPADKSGTGQDEQVSMTLHWSVQTTRRMNNHDWVERHIERALEFLRRGERALDGEPQIRDAVSLLSAIDHAISAWCRITLGRLPTSTMDTFIAFEDNAQAPVRKMVLKAGAT